MNELLNVLISVAMGLNLVLLGSSRLPTLIRVVGWQGVLLGVMPLVMEGGGRPMVVVVAAATVMLKGVVIPGLLGRAMRVANIDRDLHPMIGLLPSVLLGAAGTMGAVFLTSRMPLLAEHRETLLVAGAGASMLTGLLLLVGRSKAIAQVCGYLVLENGIFLFGLLLLHSTPLLVEGGILLDLTVGVFVIGIIVDRIQRAFDSLDTRKLTVLRE